MVLKYYAYIDEAGDEGFGKLREPGANGGQSQWLILGSALVSENNDRMMPMWRDEVLALFPQKKGRDLHFRDLSHSQRVAACNLLATKQIGVCTVASNKRTLVDHPKMDVFKQPGYLYNYIVRYLLERLTTAVALAAARAGDRGRLFITFSRRGNTDYHSMMDYMRLMRDGREVVKPIRSIVWRVLDPADVRVENHTVRAGLQLADMFTSGTAQALEPDQFGNHEPRYAKSFQHRFLKRKGALIGCGFTLIPPFGQNPLTDGQETFVRDFCGLPKIAGWAKKWQAPSPLIHIATDAAVLSDNSGKL